MHQAGRLESGQLNTMGLFDFLDGIPDDYEPKQRMSVEETEATFVYLKNHPLFMSEIPKDIENYPDLVALQHLTYDDTPENIARSCNVKANEIIQTKGGHQYFLKKAIEIYSDGIDQGCENKELQAKLFSNRALVKQKMKNFKAAIQDCKWSIEQKPDYIKPYYRAAQCLYHILHFSDAIKMCDAGLQFDKKNIEFIDLKDKCYKELVKLDQKNELEKQQQEVYQVCLSKGISLKPSQFSLPMEYQPQSLSLIEKDTITSPIIISYPEFQQRDFIQSALEKDILSKILEPLFVDYLPWDSQQQYKQNSIAFYIELEDGTYAQINQQAYVIDIMRGYKVVLPMMIELVCVCNQKQNKYFMNIFRTQYNVID